METTSLSYNYVKGGYTEVIVGLFTRGNVWHWERFQLDIRTNSLAERLVNLWNRLSREAVELPSLEIFNRCADVAAGDMAYWWTCSVRLLTGLDDLEYLF